LKTDKELNRELNEAVREMMVKITNAIKESFKGRHPTEQALGYTLTVIAVIRKISDMAYKGTEQAFAEITKELLARAKAEGLDMAEIEERLKKRGYNVEIN
jgi:uncharacterized protein (UPF0297 family)